MTTIRARWLGQLLLARLPAAIVLALVLFALPAGVAAQVSREPDGTVSVRASEVPLGRLLDLLGEISPFEMLVLKGDAGAQLVSVAAEKVTPRRALEQILESSHLDYVLSGRRLIVMESVFNGTAASAKSAGPQNVEHRERPPDGDIAEQPVDRARAEEEVRVKQIELERALSPPALEIPPGAPVELPFPGADGRTPLTEIKAPQGRVQPVPFPVAPGTRPPRATPPPTDPKLLELINALSPRRGSGG